MADDFEGIRKIPRLMVPYILLRSKTFLNWQKSLDAQIWYYLVSYVIRSPIYTGKIDIYENYWKKGKLAARWSIENIATFFGYSTISGAVAKALTRLHNQKLLIKRPIRIGRSTVNVYEFGTHDFQGNETIYAFDMFIKIAKEEALLEFYEQGK